MLSWRISSTSRQWNGYPVRLTLACVRSLNTAQPRATGNGPFIHLPSIKALGCQQGVQNIQLPQGSSMNFCLDSTMLSNRNCEGLTRSIKPLFGRRWHQETKLNCSNSLLHSFELSLNSSLASVKVSKNEGWFLESADHLAGWAGYNLQLTEEGAKVKVEGNGFFVVRASGTLYQLNVGEGQEIIVKTSSIVGSTSGMRGKSSILFTVELHLSPWLKVRESLVSVYANLFSIKNKIDVDKREDYKRVPDRELLPSLDGQQLSYTTFVGLGSVILQADLS
ncbi:biogenesis AIM24 [Metschnikowia aff. pulcherrima]|uniref:Altered inheritance of mitochondria protein 24, mitochondrial n=1 Tax=Metschnikowia aff. pulcherrima TaxID=2163413 RepID=A0A4P6XKG2_9ASCO|nr:biogenesis AIM24 [Metschnikowia aff. pulcherrima]